MKVRDIVLHRRRGNGVVESVAGDVAVIHFEDGHVGRYQIATAIASGALRLGDRVTGSFPPPPAAVPASSASSVSSAPGRGAQQPTKTRNARVTACRWCGSRADAQPEIGGGWRVACSRAHFGPKPCRAAGPVREDALRAIDDWNRVMGYAPEVQG